MDLGLVDRITAGAVGEPGRRTFYLQVRSGPRLVTVTVEKQQVQLLSQSILEILSAVDRETGEGPPEDEMGLEEPLAPRWRVGRLTIGYEERRDLMLLDLEELVAKEAERHGPAGEVAAPGRGPERIRLWATREQMLALSRHGAAVVARGRPTCRFCGNPIDPEGHRCPAMDGQGGG